ncbi:MAG: beta-glucosidase [Streptosporangiales bacterium]|nr:beta-glucosidase [Streptosporangiales bacterium]
MPVAVNTTDGTLSFPAGFRWGVAATAYQIEGAADEDGRGPSVWDTFTAQPGRVADGRDGRVACDHYHRYHEDVALMRDLGVGAYEFSLSWSRVQPTGSGPANDAGLAFYDRLVDALCAAGITPVAILYHWDHPQPLEDAGGWTSRDMTARFADYATLAADRLADRVPFWITMSEPQVLTLLGYATGVHAPGRALMFDALPVAHHLLYGHGLATEALRAAGARDVGIVENHMPVWPASESDADAGAAQAYDLLYNHLFADPVLLGRYPSEEVGAAMPGPVAEDLRTIGAPLDFYGVNYYMPALVGAPRTDGPTGGAGLVNAMTMPAGLPFELRPVDGYPRTGFGWPVVPDGLRQVLVGLRDRYGERLPPVYVTENGCSYDDRLDETGRVRDERRIAFHDGHLRAVRAAIDAGVDVRGYFAWSIMDNFEWAEGLTQRFGLVHVDYDTLVRTPKDSYHWYREVIRGTG